MKSDMEETHCKSSVVDASNGTSPKKAFSSHSLKDELTLPKMSSRNKTSEISLSTKSSSMPSSLDELMPFESENNKSPTRIKTTSELEEKYHDNFPSRRYIKSDNEDIHSKSCVADATYETSREDLSRFKMTDKPSTLNLSTRTETCETTIFEKPPAQTKTMDDIVSFFLKDICSSTATNTFSDTKGMYSDTNHCKKQANFESEKTRSQSFASDASESIWSLEDMPSDCKLKDGCLVENKNFLRSESTSEMFTNIIIDSASPDRTIPSSDTHGIDGLPVSSYSFHTHFPPIGEKNYFAMRCNENASKGQKSKLEDDGAHPLFPAKGASRGETSFQDKVYHAMASDYLQTDGSLASWSGIRDETNDSLSFTEFSSTEFSNSNKMSCETQTDNACPELAITHHLYCDSSSSSSSSSSMGDYYDDDEDLQQFCEQDMLTYQSGDVMNYIVALENENNERPDLIENNVSSDRNRGTPCSKFMLKEVDPSLNELVIQVQQFFKENPPDDNEIMSRQESMNNILTSRYFTDEFAQQHIPLVNENGATRIGNTLEDRGENELQNDSVNLNLVFERGMKM